MVNCVCGKPLEKVPSWLSGTSIQFVCNNCPNRTVKSITQVQLETPKDPEAEETGALEAAFAKDADEDEVDA